jgi:ankyrin repeat protein
VVPTAEGAAEAVKLLLDRGMDPDAFNTAGNTAVHGAVGRGEEVIKTLASHGATLNLKNKAGFTPLDLALGQGGGRRGGAGVVRQNIADLLRQLQGLPAPPAQSAPAAGAAAP